METEDYKKSVNFWILSSSCMRRRTIKRGCDYFLSENNLVGHITTRHNLRFAERNFFADTRLPLHTAIIDLVLCREDKQIEMNLTPGTATLHSFSPLYLARRLKQTLPECHLLFLGTDQVDFFKFLLSQEIHPDFWLLPHKNLTDGAVLCILNMFSTAAWRESVNPTIQ